jgi:hypothetical protein
MTAAWRSIRTYRPSARRRSRRLPATSGPLRFLPSFDLVEDRTLLSTFMVTSTADSGPGSLRQAILDSNAATGQTNTIDFAIPGQGVQTITPVSPLPAISNSVLIDGTSQPGYAGTPLIALDTSTSGTADALTITGSAVTVRGMANGGFALGSGAMPDDLTLQSVPLEASHGVSANPFGAYRIDTSGDGRLHVQVHCPGVAVPLSLLDAQGRVLVESDGVSPAHLDSMIDQHLSAGTYFLKVVTQAGTGQFILKATFTPASPPFQPIPVGIPGFHNPGYDPLATGDFNGDGILDLATMDGVHLGVGDGTFQEPTAGLRLSAGNPNLDGIVVGDFNGDGKLDLAVRFTFRNTIAVLLGNGDGSLQAPVYYAVGRSSGRPYGAGDILVAGDFTGNGHLDLATANSGSNDVSVLLGKGDGTFQPAVEYAVGERPDALAAGDFAGNGRLDLAVACQGNEYPYPSGTNPGGVSVLMGNGDGTFQRAREYAAGQSPVALTSGHFTSDAKLDLAFADAGDVSGSGTGVSLMLGNGDGTFRAAQTIFTGFPSALVAGDFSGNGHLDLAISSWPGSTVSVLVGNGDGTFQAPQTYVLGASLFPFSLVAGDFTGNGRLDLATADYFTNNLFVLLNNGEGTFEVSQQLAVGPGPSSLAEADFTGNGRLDLATANFGSNDVSVLLGNGDATFQRQERFAAGIEPSFIVAGDFNGDGRIDLAVADNGDANGNGSGVSVLLGNGDGTFQPPQAYAMGLIPSALVAGDFTGDGRPDLAAVGVDLSTGAGAVSVLLNNGDGTFQPAMEYAVGSSPDALLASDFAGDGRLDLAVVDNSPETGSSEVSMLLGNGDGTFKPAVRYAVGLSPYGFGQGDPIVAGDFTGDGRLDLAVSGGYVPSTRAGAVSVLLGNGDGTFQPANLYAVGGIFPDSIVAGDFTGGGRLDLAVVDANPDTGASEVAVLLGNGDGTFQSPVQFAVGGTPNDVMAGDFTGNGRLDLAVTNSGSGDISLLLGNGDGTFVGSGQLATTPFANPLVADVNGDGARDVLVVDGHGNVLYRQAIPGQPGSFEPPVTVNPGSPSRDIAWVPDTAQGPVLASVDAHDRAISFYAFRNGGFVQIGSLATGRLPAQIVAADLNGDGLTDLVVRNAGDGTLSVYLGSPFLRISFMGPLNPQLAPPSFLPHVTLPVGIGASDVQADDTTGSGMLDLVVTNKLTGQVSILRNLGSGTFAPPEPYRAGNGLSASDTTSTPEVTSLEATAGVAAGPLKPGGPTDLVTANPGSNTMDVLAGLGQGRFANPVTIHTPSPALALRMGDFTGNGVNDLAVLSANVLRVYLGDGNGGFLPPTSYAMPSEADGLTVADLSGNGKLDVLVGDAYGDVLVLLGYGDGSFRPYRKTDQSVALAVADLTGNGSKDVIFADQGLDRVVVDYGAGGSTVLGDHATGLLDPGAVKLADLNGDGIPDLIVANSGSNNVLIYPGLGNGQFGPAINGGHGYFVGTNPVGITVANLTGALPDLVVADKGSNQVSILLNKSHGGTISFEAGPRLNSGGIGPVSTVVGHFTGSSNPDILVSNSGSNNVALLPGVGGGFFNDTNPQTFAVGTNPGPIFTGNFDGKADLVTVNAGSNDLTLISDFMLPDAVTETISSGGTDPVTAFSFSAGSGFDNLVVGNGGDGVLALFEGSDQGLSLSSTETNPDLPSPSALVYAGLAGGQVQFYGASEGREAAALVALSLGGEIAPALAPVAPATPAVAQVVPLQESSLALVGTFLITTLPSPTTEVNLESAESEVATTVSLATTAAASVGQSVAAQPRGDDAGGSGDEPPAQPKEAKDATEAPAASSWQQHVLGTDEAIERFDREHPDLSQPSRHEPPQPEEPQESGHQAGADVLEAIGDLARETNSVGCVKRSADAPFAGLGTRGGSALRLTHPTRATNPLARETNSVAPFAGLGTRGGSALRLTHPTKKQCKYAAALALAATVAGESYFRSTHHTSRSLRRFPGIRGRWNSTAKTENSSGDRSKILLCPAWC